VNSRVNVKNMKKSVVFMQSVIKMIMQLVTKNIFCFVCKWKLLHPTFM